MPYVITTKRPVRADKEYHLRAMSHRVVATLEEARDYVSARVPNAWDLGMPESGGTVGPLPDGIVIEVENWGASRVTAWFLENAIWDYPPVTDWEAYTKAFCDAFNAQEAAHA